MSSTRHTVMRGPSFTGLGKRPDLTPAHQVLFDTGIMAGIGGQLVESPMILGNRTKPVSGKGVEVFLIGSIRFSPVTIDCDLKGIIWFYLHFSGVVTSIREKFRLICDGGH